MTAAPKAGNNGISQMWSRNIVVVRSTFQAGRFTDGGSSNVGWATSTNSGVTWTSGFLPGTTVYATPPGTYARATDPAVTYDIKKHIWMIVVLVLNSSGTGVAILVSRSTDGLTWKNPVTAVLAGSNDNLDKTWIVCDNNKTSPFNGHCYIEFDNFALGDLEEMTTSIDAGRAGVLQKRLVIRQPALAVSHSCNPVER